ncbi:hypothetical protein EBU95_03900 [bacterium]|nr:hypothetical protein [bacterium]
MNFLINAICAGVVNYQACVHSIINSSNYLGIDKMMDNAEKMLIKKISKENIELFSKAGIAYEIIRTKTIEVTLPSEKVLRIIPSNDFRVKVNDTEALISLVWYF